MKLTNNDVACIMFPSSTSTPIVNVAVIKVVWHRRPRHPALWTLNSVVKDCNLLVKDNENFNFCDACKYGKSHALLFSNPSSHSTLPHFYKRLKILCSFLDDFSMFVWIYPLKFKSDTVTPFHHFTIMVGN